MRSVLFSIVFNSLHSWFLFVYTTFTPFYFPPNHPKVSDPFPPRWYHTVHLRRYNRNKEKSVILQDFFFGQIIPCFFFPFCSLLLLLLFRNSFFSFHCFPKGSLPSAFSWGGYSMTLDTSLWNGIFFRIFSPMVQCLPSFVTPLHKASFWSSSWIYCATALSCSNAHSARSCRLWPCIPIFFSSTNRHICHTFRMIVCYFNQLCLYTVQCIWAGC